MMIHSYNEMLKEYETQGVEIYDMTERDNILQKNKYTVIFEGDFLEFDNANEWINLNIKNPTSWLFYGKIGYNYGFFEFFFESEEQAQKVEEIIPNIFTTYPNEKTSKTMGYNNEMKL